MHRPDLIRASCFLYKRLLILYPRRLREQFTVQMVEVFEDSLLDLPPHRPALAFISLWRTALWELASVGIVSRLQDSFLIATAVSVLLSSLLTWFFFWVVRA